jgi:hypothetical protein
MVALPWPSEDDAMKTLQLGLSALLVATVCCGTGAGAVTLSLPGGGQLILGPPSATDEGYTSLTTIGNQNVVNGNGQSQAAFTTTGGATPDVQVSVYKSDALAGSCYAFGCGGLVGLYATYQFTWYTGNPGPAADTLSTTLNIATLDQLIANNGGSADAYMVISGINGTLYDQEDAVGTEIDGVVVPASGPLGNANVEIYNDELYTVQLGVTAEPGGLGFDASASIDPSLILADGSGGALYYSDDIDMPEPGSLTVLAIGAQHSRSASHGSLSETAPSDAIQTRR